MRLHVLIYLIFCAKKLFLWPEIKRNSSKLIEHWHQIQLRFLIYLNICIYYEDICIELIILCSVFVIIWQIRSLQGRLIRIVDIQLNWKTYKLMNALDFLWCPDISTNAEVMEICCIFVTGIAKMQTQAQS